MLAALVCLCVTSLCQFLVSHNCRYVYYVWRATKGLRQVQFTTIRVVSMVVNMQVRGVSDWRAAFPVCRFCHVLSQPLVPARLDAGLLFVHACNAHAERLPAEWHVATCRIRLICMQIHLRTISFLTMLHSTQLLWCDAAMGVTEPAFMPGKCLLHAHVWL